MNHPENEILRLYPTPSEVIPESLIYEDLWEPRSGRPDLPRVIINMVSSLDGKASVEGRAGQIGGETDRRVMRVLRSRADGVMVGAGTLRAEKIALDIPLHLSEERLKRGRTTQPLIILISKSGELPAGNPIRSAPRNTLILTRCDLAEDKASRLSERGQLLHLSSDIPSDTDAEYLTSALWMLKRDHGVNLLLVEGGPSLNHELLSLGLVHEFFVTLSPKLLGGTPEDTLSPVNGPILRGQSSQPRLISAYLSSDQGNQQHSELFLRYALRK